MHLNRTYAIKRILPPLRPPIPPPPPPEHDLGPDDVHIPGHAQIVVNVIS